MPQEIEPVNNAHEAIIRTPDGSVSAGIFQIKFHQELLKSADLPDLANRVARLLKRWGFSGFSLTRTSNKNPDTAIVLDTNPLVVRNHYQHRHVWEQDIMLHYLTMNTEPIFQSTIDHYIDAAPFDTETILSNRETRKFVKGLDFHDYYAIPFGAANGNGNVFMAITTKGCNSLDFRDLTKKNQTALAIMARAIDYIATRKFPKTYLEATENRHLIINPRPLQLLKIMAQGNLTLENAASQIGISTSTANKHIADAREALGARTTVSALYRAMKEGLID